MKRPTKLKKILIIDFGSQFTQLIARRIRELGVFSEIVSHKKIKSKDINKFTKGIILSGGPLNVYEIKKYSFDKDIILKMNNFLLGNLRPNFTFLSIVNKKNMLKRLKLRKNKNKYDNFDYNFYNKVQKGFLKIASKNKSKYLILDTNKDNLKIIENKLINKIERILK